MLTKLIIQNFKKFERVEIPLGNGYAFIGPNNSGKTSALQALALWHAGLRKWLEKRGGGEVKEDTSARKRYGVVINRKDLLFLPTVHANSLWQNKKVRKNTDPIRLEITVAGIAGNAEWQCGLEFDYANEDTFYCRPLRTTADGKQTMPIPEAVKNINVVLIPPMSGLAEREPLLQYGQINVLLGQGRTAEVLRNICYLLSTEYPDHWKKVCADANELFGIKPQTPAFDNSRGEIELSYKQGSTRFDIQSAGRGTHQVLLLLSFLFYKPAGTIFLLDEPDAHLEILRQQTFYNLIKKRIEPMGAQILIASHSEKILNESASNDAAVSFAGIPAHITKDKTSEVLKSLSEIGWDKYSQARQKKWVLFVESASDISILTAFARQLKHGAEKILEKDFFVQYIGTDQMRSQYGVFSALRLAVPTLRGLAITDQLQTNQNPPSGLERISWKKREIENYLFSRALLLQYADGFDRYEDETLPLSAKYKELMERNIDEFESALARTRAPALFSDDSKISDRVDELLEDFFKSAKLPPTMRKRDFHQLVQYIPKDDIDPEITEKLDAIVAIAEQAEADNEETP